jgi:hypothetical protein
MSVWIGEVILETTGDFPHQFALTPKKHLRLEPGAYDQTNLVTEQGRAVLVHAYQTGSGLA